MLINALMKYANNLKDVCFVLPTQKIDYRIIISDKGELLDIVEFNKEIPYPIAPTGRTSGLKSCVLDYNSKYIFGMYFNEKSKTLELDNRGCNNVFKQVQLDFFNNLNNVKCNAIKNFVNYWKPEEQINNPIFDKIKTALNKKFAFSLNTLDNYIETDELFLDKYIQNNITDNNGINICSITGKSGSYAELHNKIKIPGCSMGGQPIITYNNSSTSESYNSEEKQSSKSYIATDTMNVYTYVLNKLINSDVNHTNIWNKNDSTTFIYFSTSSKCNDLCNSAMSILLDDDETVTDDTLKSIMDKIKKTESIDLSDIDINSSDFYLFELNPNAQANKSRICIKNQYYNSFGNMVNNINSFQNRFRINNNTKPIRINDIIRASLPYGTEKYKEYRDTSEYVQYYTDFINIALNDMQIPINVFQKVVNECKKDFILCKIDGKYNTPPYLKSIRHRIIKAYINYKYNKEVIDMSLNVNSNNFKLPFMLGELFALYEHKQKMAQPNINNTIGKMYFNRAVESPNYIIAELHKKTIMYDNKIVEGGLRYWINDLISKQIDKVYKELEKGGVIPNKFNLEEQSCFVLGYEKMKTYLYTKKDDKTNSKKTEVTNTINE